MIPYFSMFRSVIGQIRSGKTSGAAPPAQRSGLDQETEISWRV